MYSMWNAPSDLDYYAQFNPEPPDDEEPEELEPEDPFEVPMLCDDAEEDGTARQAPAMAAEALFSDMPEVA